MTTGRINQGASFSKCSFEQKLVVVVRTTRITRREANTPPTRGSGRKTAEPTARRTQSERVRTRTIEIRAVY